MTHSPRYVPFSGPITPETLDDLFAHHRAAFPGVTMKKDDDEEEVDDPGDDDTDDDGDEDDEDDDDPDAGKTDEELRAELRETRASLQKANAEAKRRRLKAREAQQQKPGKHKAATSKDDEDDDEDRTAEVEAKWKARTVRQGAKAALATAGAAKPERLLRLVDVDALDVDDDGEVEGLDDEIDRLREEYPELFRRTRAGRVETGDRSGGRGASKPKTATERQAAAILGRK